MIKKETFIYNDEECLLVLIRDVTDFEQLQETRQKVRMMEMLQATVSHDLISPVNNIKLFADSMLQHALKRNIREVRRSHTMIVDSARIAQCRFKDLLDQSLIENNSFVPSRERFEPEQAIDMVKNMTAV